MTPERARSWRRGVITIIALATLYQIAALSGHFAPALMPPLGKVARTLLDSIIDGTMLGHAAATLYRVLCGFALAVLGRVRGENRDRPAAARDHCRFTAFRDLQYS